MAKKKYDLVIVGGGMIGTALAVALADRFTLALIEASWPVQPRELDMRVTALNNASVNLLKQLNAWESIKRVCPFNFVEVWEEGVPPLCFSAQDINKDQLGFIVENSLIQISLLKRLQQHKNVTLITEKVMNINPSLPHPQIKLEKTTLEAALIIGADGHNSVVRQQVGIGAIRLEHPQRALVLQVKTDSSQQNTTWQRFTPTGAQAFLPLSNGHASLVWYNSPEYSSRLNSFNNKKLSAHLHQAYPSRLGKVIIEKKIAFPIQAHHTEEYVRGATLLIGDAAHSFHPLAGQGANFGFKDVQVLAELLREPQDINPDRLSEYQKKTLCSQPFIYARLRGIPLWIRHPCPTRSVVKTKCIQGSHYSHCQEIASSRSRGRRKESA